MEFTSPQVSEQAECTEARVAVDGGCGAAVCVSAVDVAGLSEEGLRARIKSIGRAESKLAAMKSKAVAEMARQHNPVAAERVVQEETRTSRRAARHDVKAAEQLASLETTSEALAAGDITENHARRIARASSEGNINEQALVEAAKTENLDDFDKTVRRQHQELSDDDGMGILEKQRSQRNLRMFKTKDTGMFVLNGEFDPVIGDHIAGAIAVKERELWHQEDPNARRTPQQRMADALAELILEPEKTKATGIALVLVADYDATQRELQNARLSDGSPLPMPELVRLALKANIFPSVFDANTQNLWLGRSRRTASDAQRIALTVRDQGCVGCGNTAYRCFAHHVEYWSNGGPTDYPNLVLVCNDCHHSIHDDYWQVTQHPETGRWTTQPPPEPFPDNTTTSWRPANINPVLRN